VKFHAFSGRVQIFQNGRWSEWMSEEDGRKLENEMYYGSRPYRGIWLLSDAQAAGVASSSRARTARGRVAK
jgi:hypothetical protein